MKLMFLQLTCNIIQFIRAVIVNRFPNPGLNGGGGMFCRGAASCRGHLCYNQITQTKANLDSLVTALCLFSNVTDV